MKKNIDDFEFTDLDLETNLVRHFHHTMSSIQSVNITDSLHNKGNKNFSDEFRVNGHEENEIQNAEDSGNGHNASTT